MYNCILPNNVSKFESRVECEDGVVLYSLNVRKNGDINVRNGALW